jgi:hypothetical protein
MIPAAGYYIQKVRTRDQGLFFFFFFHTHRHQHGRWEMMAFADTAQ